MASRGALRPLSNLDWNNSRNDVAPKRRQTITNSRSRVSLANPNAKPRHSLAPNTKPRVSLAPQSRVPVNRTSLAPRNSLAPRQSLASRKSTAKPNDAKKLMESNIRKIIQFLSIKQYPSNVSVKMLQQPTVKDFQDVTLFLFRQIDNGYDWKGVPEEDIPKFFKQIHCPFTLNRSSLRAVSSIATWPTVLQALGWLVDLLNYQAAEQELQAESDEFLHQKLFFEFLGLTYHQYLQEGTHEFDELETDLANFFTERNEKVKDSIAEISDENELLLAKIQKLQAENEKVPQLHESLVDITTKCDEFEQCLSTWETHRDALQERNDELSTKLKEANQQLVEVQNEQQEVYATLDKQEMKSEDVQRLYSDRSQLQQELQIVMKHHQSLQVQSTELEQHLQALFNDVQPSIRQYNQTATEMKLIPSTAKYAEGFVFEIDLQPRNLYDDSYHIEIKKDIKLKITKLKVIFNQKKMDFDEKRIQLQHLQEQEIEKLQEKKEESVDSQRKLEKSNQQAQDVKQQKYEELQQIQNEVRNLREKTQRLEKSSQEELNHAAQQHQQMERHLEERKAEMEEHKENVTKQYYDTCTKIIHHKEYLKERLDQMLRNVKRDLYCLE